MYDYIQIPTFTNYDIATPAVTTNYKPVTDYKIGKIVKIPNQGCYIPVSKVTRRRGSNNRLIAFTLST